MDQHPLPPAEQSPAPAAPRSRAALAVGVVSVLAIAAATVGAGAYMAKDSLVWQRILGTEQQPEAAVGPADALLPLLDSAALAGSATDPESAAKLHSAWVATRGMLEGHVGLLTPAAAAGSTGPETPSGSPSASSSGSSPSTSSPAAGSAADAKAFAQRLAAAGVSLVDAAMTAPAQESRSLAGAGFELTLQARNLMAAAGGTQEQVDKLPVPRPTAATDAAPASASAGPSAATSTTGTANGPTAMPRFMLSSCPAVPEAPAAAISASPSQDTAASGTREPAEESGMVLGQVADAAYRLGYAYDVAGSRSAGSVRDGAWARSARFVAFAAELEDQFGVVGTCEPLRQPAYQLPGDAASNPLDAARTGEEQLALLLRDAAATQEGDDRAYLLQRAWDQGLYTRQVTGRIPDFTKVEGTPARVSTSGSPTPTP